MAPADAVIALALGDVGGAVHPLELGQEVSRCHTVADAGGLAGSVHIDAGDGAGGVKAHDDVHQAAVVAGLPRLDGNGTVGRTHGAADAGGGVVGDLLQLGGIRDGGDDLDISRQGCQLSGWPR